MSDIESDEMIMPPTSPGQPGPGQLSFDPSSPDHSGKAALLLVESLLHGLVEQSVISVAEALDIVDTAVEVSTDAQNARDAEESPPPADASAAALLMSISRSLHIDLHAN